MQNTENTRSIGICLGASTISAVELTKEGDSLKITKTIRKPHEGNPKNSFIEVLKELNPGNNKILITGRKLREFVNLPSITEPEAVEYALEFTVKNGRHFDAVVTAGGETFMVYAMDGKNRISRVFTGNKCASGTGEFFLQQIKRMNLPLEKAVELGEKGEPYHVSGRCSVFCKSDCTHALNKGEPIENVTAGLCEMIAMKIVELVSKVIPHDNVLVIGGTSLNRAVMKHLKRYVPGIVILDESPYFEALGAAIVAFEKGSLLPEEKNIFKHGKSSFNFLPPLKNAEKFVTFNKMQYGVPQNGDRCIIGLDVGSTTTKAVLLRLKDDNFLTSVYLRTDGNPVEASRKCYKSILEQLKGTAVDIVGIGITGSGRHIAGLYSLTDGIINEIIAHASAASFFDMGVDTIFEIGGQDAKYTHLTNSVASDYAMNEACSAGTGSFLEESAYESFLIKAEQIADEALKGDRPPNFNDQCAAFISSDIKNAVQEGISRENILAGLVYSICFNYINRVKGNRQVGDKIFMQGGVCYNRAVPLAMASVLQKPIIVPPEPGLMGAFGVALELKKRFELGLLKEKKFDLQTLIDRQVINEKPFTCAGGKEKCDLKCTINRIKIEGKIYPFGGACNKYYNIENRVDIDTEKLDLVKIRQDLMFNKYAPVYHTDDKSVKIGLNSSLLTYNVFPLYYNFFGLLGCRVIVPDKMNMDALNRQTTSFCYPAQISICYFDTLISKNPDYYFIPQLRELYVEKGNQKQDFCATCIFSQGESYWLNSVFKDKKIKDKIINPTINFRKGYESQENVFVEIAGKLKISRAKARIAYKKAVRIQKEFETEIREIGRKALEELRKEPEKFAIVLFGRPHNAFTNEANKGIPKKIATRGFMVIPYDMLEYEDEELMPPFKDSMHWEIGQKLLKASQLVYKDSALFAVYITNFLCAIDSFLVQHVRRVMKTKPSLTLELDGHTADAGINTRIDAFLDVIKNYLLVQKRGVKSHKRQFIPARLVTEKNELYFVGSNEEKTLFKDPSVKVLLPSMGDLGTKALAAALRRVGINSEALPVADEEVRRFGRSVLTGKECIPLVVILGSFLKYLKHNRKPGEKIAIFMPKAHGYCRLGQYFITTELMIKEKHIEDAVPYYFAGEVGYAGLGTDFSLAAWKGIVISDVMDDIRNALYTLAVDINSAMEIFYKEYEEILAIIEKKSKKNLYKKLEETAEKLRQIPLKQKFKDTPQVMINGEIFVRCDQWANNNITKMLAKKGFVGRRASIHEWLFYNNHLIKHGIFNPDYKLKEWIEFYVSDAVQIRVERKIKNILVKSELYDPEVIDVSEYDKYSEHLISHRLTGEPGLSTGKILKDGISKYAGHINIGPFGCMITRFTDSIASNNLDIKDKKEAYRVAGEKYESEIFFEGEKIPFLTIEVDGNPYPQLLLAKFESFCLQAKRVAEKQGKKVVEEVLA
ncbi:MAG: activase [Candidatus Goldbacteria bacterium]|nr:activase [Candidatus Goldiibacteriota bacterium]